MIFIMFSFVGKQALYDYFFEENPAEIEGKDLTINSAKEVFQIAFATNTSDRSADDRAFANLFSSQNGIQLRDAL